MEDSSTSEAPCLSGPVYKTNITSDGVRTQAFWIMALNHRQI